MFELDNRELAGLIWFCVLIVVVVAVPSLRRSLVPSVLGVTRALAAPKVLFPILGFFVYVFFIVRAFWRMGWWTPELLTETILVTLFMCLPMVMSAHQVSDGSKLVKGVIRRVLGVSALVVFYVGLIPLPLGVELILQPMVVLLTVAWALSETEQSRGCGLGLAGAFLGVIGIFLLIRTSRVILSDWGLAESMLAAREFGVSVLLPLLSLPYVYLFAFIMGVEVLLVMLPRFNQGARPPMSVQIAAVWGFHGSTAKMSAFNGRWRQNIANASNRRGATEVMRQFRSAHREFRSSYQDYTRGMRAMAGLLGTDAEGRQLDRREFHETKEALTNLAYAQSGQFRTNGCYLPELPVDVFVEPPLSSKHGVRHIVSEDQKSWAAWRRTPGGWVLGAGGTDDLDRTWRYSGGDEPSTFASVSDIEWVDGLEPLPDWSHNDEPPMWF